MPGPRLRIPLMEAGAVALQKALTGPGRELNPEERRLLLSIFGNSVNLDPVELTMTSVGPKGRPYTFGNTIRVPNGTVWQTRYLVHEMTHVWQYQTRGTRYISDSAFHQVISGQGAYDVQLVPGQSIFDYTAEQQAIIVEQYYADDPPGWSKDPDVVRMIGEVRTARPLSSEAIQKETWFGPGAGALDKSAPSNDPNRPSQTVPLLRIEF
jgi:hypothetical protein